MFAQTFERGLPLGRINVMLFGVRSRAGSGSQGEPDRIEGQYVTTEACC